MDKKEALFFLNNVIKRVNERKRGREYSYCSEKLQKKLYKMLKMKNNIKMYLQNMHKIIY